MSIWKFGTFLAKEGKGPELRLLLSDIARVIRSSPGSRSCRLLEHESDPARFAILEEWDDVEAHKASVARNVTEERRARFTELVGSATSSDYFRD